MSLSPLGKWAVLREAEEALKEGEKRRRELEEKRMDAYLKEIESLRNNYAPCIVIHDPSTPDSPFNQASQFKSTLESLQEEPKK